MSTTRTGFSSRLGFVAAAAGSAVGLGNIWKFPYETADNGGGAFFLIYLLCIFLIGFPVMVGEISLGRHTRSNPYGAYLKTGNKNWALVGILGVACGFMILSFYNVIAGWAFGYFLKISFGDLLNEADFGAFFGSYVGQIGELFFFSLAFMAITAFVVMRGVQKGIESAAKILMPVLLAILLGLIIYALTLPGSWEGVEYYLKPDFSKLNLDVINSAMGHAFFSLSLGMGALITYGSYIGKQDNITSSAAIVTVADTGVAFLAGMLLLPLMFAMDLEAAQGPSLIFVVLPKAFAEMGPIVGKVVGGSFFLLVCVAALTSTISLLEVPVSYFVDERKWSRGKSVSVVAAVIFLIGIPSMMSQGFSPALSGGEEGIINYGGKTQDFLTLVADAFSEVSLPLGGLLMSLFVAFRWKTANLSDEISKGNPSYKGSTLEKFINIAISYVCPIILGFIFISNLLEKFFGFSFMH